MAPPDDSVRREVCERLDETLFVEAGAGSGKTSCLVGRFVALVEAGVPAEAVAAITFTERAAAELADRIRQGLQHRVAAGSERCAAALDSLDRAAICTLHAFAQRMLTEHPVEAGLPPRFEVLDDIGSQIAFQHRWEAFVDRLLGDPHAERPLRLLLAAGASLGHLRDVAVAFNANWDLVAARAGGPVPELPSLLDRIEAFCDDLEALSGQRFACTDPDDRLSRRLEVLAAWSSSLRRLPDEELVLERLHSSSPSLKVARTGAKGNWPDIATIRIAVAAIDERRRAMADEVVQACLCHLAESLAAFTVGSAEARRGEGALEFHDLLVLARAVLRHPVYGWPVRQALRHRYQRLLLDEFQDTDPIQVELAVLLGSGDPDAGTRAWTEVDVEPGRLFFVGDPKQSIYRFRRADIGTFLDARDALVDAPRQLVSNFRTVEPIVEWVNRTFSSVIAFSPRSQPCYVDLRATRAAPQDGPAVALVGAEALPGGLRADGVREREAGAVVTAVRRAVAEGWSVSERHGDDERWRPARWADIAILLPARTSLPMLERALEVADVPYRVETSSLAYGTAEVRDLLAVARAVEDPTDALWVVTALRSAPFGCGDDDLYRWHVDHGGWWDHQGRLPEGAPPDHPVRRGLEWLGDLHRQRAWLAPSQVLDRIVRERRLMELAFAHPRPRDLWRRLRFVVDQARAWEEAGGTTLREYLAWVALQAAEGSRVVETVLPETDDEAVRILTVHGAKGLEFPITVLSGLTTQLRAYHRGVHVLFPEGDGWAVKLGKGMSTAEFDLARPLDEQMDHHERLRLLYVAATRARDHLVVSVHRRAGTASDRVLTSAELFWDHGNLDELVSLLDDESPVAVPATTAPPGDGAPGAGLPPLVTREEWGAGLATVLDVARRPLAWSATGIAEARARLLTADPGLHKEPRDVDLPPWQKGRYGSAVGRAVHAVLQGVDLAGDDDLAGPAAAQAAAEEVLGREAIIEALVRSALEAPTVRRAAGRPHWQEVYVGVPFGDGVLEGYVDLLFRDDGGFVVVDYKTDSWRYEEDLHAKVDRYRLQLAAYAHAVAGAVGQPVVRAVLLFLAPAGAVEREVPDLPGAVAEVLSLAQA
ncbi:MAG: UvrD-helicase domain-containing protein [Acidimicrobiales bacterium]